MTVIYDAFDGGWFVVDEGGQETGPFDTEQDAWDWIDMMEDF